MAAYHQYYAVNRAVESTLRAAGYILPEALDKTLPELLEGSYVNESPESYGLAGVKNNLWATVKAAWFGIRKEAVNRFRWFSLPAKLCWKWIIRPLW